MFFAVRKVVAGARFVVVLVAILIASNASHGQEVYQPLKTHSDESGALIDGLRDQYEEELAKIDRAHRQRVRQIYLNRTNQMIKSIGQRIYIDDPFLEERIAYIMDRLLKHNTVRNVPKRILIQKNPIPNAFCYGEGTLVVTVGLIGNISNESQLAFTLAHELAHYELDHVKNRILQQIETNYIKKARAEMEKVLNGEGDSDNVAVLRSMVYGESKFSRESELEADSLGFVLFRNAGYNEAESVTMLSILDSAQVPVGPALFLPFHSTKLPFQDHWVRKRLSVYSKTYDNTLFFSNDSITSHPDISMRRQALTSFVSRTDRPLNYQSDADIAELATVAAFESVESAYFLRQFDRCLHQALRLWVTHPDDSYLVAIISKVLISLYPMDETTFSLYVPKYTGYYNSELRLVNNFLNNLTREELADIAYNFLNSEKHFDDGNEEHYFLLWRLCDLTERKELQKRVKQVYTQKFGKGKFGAEMR
jgi:Zn-dependent protease with chaperone function